MLHQHGSRETVNFQENIMFENNYSSIIFLSEMDPIGFICVYPLQFFSL